LDVQEKKALDGVGGLPEILGLEVMTEGISTGTTSESWREGVPDFMGCNAETIGIK